MEQKTIDLAAELQAENEDDLFNTLTAISDIAERLANKRTKKTTEANRMNKNYGLTGKTVKAKFKGGDSDAYPWQGMAVPVLITGEYENFLVGEVLPHYAPHGFGLSHPYPITICKHDIQIGEMIINGGSIK